MSASSGTQKVFRLRRLPESISSRKDVAKLLGKTLSVSSDQITVYSLAKTSNQCGSMSKVATVQFKSIPPILDPETPGAQWKFPIPDSQHDEVLILDTHFRGMTVLNDVEKENHRADCIAISGLASHPFGSWQPHGPDKSFMWIRDELPNSVPGVRAILYGYDSRLKDSKSFQSISDIAGRLILNLMSGGWNLPRSRPIIFLAHSLGGIVLKEAIVRMAGNTDKSEADILNNLLGAIMFGVPNLGMEQSHLVDMVEGQDNETLVQDLSRNNGRNYVRQLDEKFKGLSIVHILKILWAYETESSAALVNTDSATCYHHRKNKSLTIPINKNHSDMVKFSQGDEDLDTIIFSLNDLLKERLGQPLFAPNDAYQSQQTLPGANMAYQSTDEGVSTEDEKVLKDLGSFLSSIQGIHNELYSPELDSRINQIEDPSQNTFNWIFHRPRFSQWLRKKSGLFWINGKPGSGKSTLMKHVFRSQSTKDLVHKWETSSIDIKAGFFFHYRGTAIQKSFEGVLRSLIIQILKPHRIAFQKKYQGAWEEFQSSNQRYRTLEEHRASIKYDLDAIIEEKALMASERDLKEKLKRAMNDNRSDANEQTMRDIEQQLSLIHRRMEEVSKQSLDVREREPELQQELNQLRADIATVSQSISSLAEKARPYQTQPETRFLRSLVNELRNESNSQVVRLERILSLLLDQDIMNINLVLFFDALDEFDGHIENMSDFLTSLVERSTTSKTQIKVCFSSRPRESLNDHFTKYPGFRLQDHTKADIEQYAKGSLARSEIMNSSQREEIMKIIPSIIARADGVFLWVRLAMKELFDTAGGSPEAELSDCLKRKLQELPVDLFTFYKHIIERVSEENRPYTFALLELLARHAGLSVSVTDIWGAVLTSGCTTFKESLEVLQKKSEDTGQNIVTDSDWDQRAISDISAWAGGLVEIKAQNNLQLMHQTVLEFTRDQTFKSIVMGEVADFMKENGHSFYFKYWVTKTGLRRYEEANNTKQWTTAAQLGRLSAEEQKECKLAADHAEKSESTTGISQLDFIGSIPRALLRLLRTCPPIYDDNTVFLTFASSYGLTLCIRDWIDENPDRLRRIFRQEAQPPLLTSLAFEPASGVLLRGHLTTTRLLLDKGYNITKDTRFFPSLLEEIWKAETKAAVQGGFSESSAQTVIAPILQELAAVVLDNGQDPNVFCSMFSWANLPRCTPLHVAPPGLADKLIRCNANVNAPDSGGKKPLDWVLNPPRWSPRWSCARRYEMCCLLVKAGGLMSDLTLDDDWIGALTEFDDAGYDTQALRSNYPRPLAAAAPSSGDSNVQDSKKRHHRRALSFLFGWLKKR